MFSESAGPSFEEIDLKRLTNIEAVHSGPLRWLIQRAETAIQEERYEEALPVFEKMLELGRGQKEVLLFAHLNLAKIYGLFKIYRKLKKHFLSAITLEPDEAELRIQLAENLANLGKHREALAAFRATLEREPNHPYFLCRFGAFLLRAGKADEAAGIFNRALELAPKDVEILRQYALFLTDVGDFAAAKITLTRALKLDPHHRQTVYVSQLLDFLQNSLEPKPLPAALDRSGGLLENPEKKPRRGKSRSAGSNRFFHDGFSYVMRENTDSVHWIEDQGTRYEDYQTYLAKKPSVSLSFPKWRELDDELLHLIFVSSLRDLEARESERLEELQALL